MSLIHRLQNKYDVYVASEVLAGLELREAFDKSLIEFVYTASRN